MADQKMAIKKMAITYLFGFAATGLLLTSSVGGTLGGTLGAEGVYYK